MTICGLTPMGSSGLLLSDSSVPKGRGFPGKIAKNQLDIYMARGLLTCVTSDLYFLNLYFSQLLHPFQYRFNDRQQIYELAGVYKERKFYYLRQFFNLFSMGRNIYIE